MITLEKVIHENPFEKYPQLQNIWPEPFKTTAMEATVEHFDLSKNYPDIDIGNIYIIKHQNDVIGITGFYIYTEDDSFKEYNPNMSNFGLRWHGIISEQRGKGYSELAMILVAKEISNLYNKAEKLIELIPQTTYGNPLKKHFEKLGFTSFGQVENYDWSEYAWQPYELNIPAFLNKHNINISSKKKGWF